jgi:hypothetical protein
MYIWRRGLQREAESSCYPARGGGQATGIGAAPPPLADHPRVGGWERDLNDCWELAG